MFLFTYTILLLQENDHAGVHPLYKKNHTGVHSVYKKNSYGLKRDKNLLSEENDHSGVYLHATYHHYIFRAGFITIQETLVFLFICLIIVKFIIKPLI